MQYGANHISSNASVVTFNTTQAGQTDVAAETAEDDLTFVAGLVYPTTNAGADSITFTPATIAGFINIGDLQNVSVSGISNALQLDG